LWRAAAFAICCTACSPTFTSWGHAATAGAVEELTGDAGTQALSALASSAAKAATDSARDELLGQVTRDDIVRLEVAAGDGARAQLERLITVRLQERIRQTLRLSIDEALGARTRAEVDALREELAGDPLRLDVEALIDEAAPHLAQAVQAAVAGAVMPLQTDVAKAQAAADLEAAKWRPIAIGFAVGAGLLLVCLVLAITLIRSHQKTIVALARRAD
jgi:hypothetical protein